MSVNRSGYLLWLADAARDSGLPVVETDGWQRRGHDDYIDCRGVLLHHTANPNPGNYTSLPTIVNGRADLPGPLAGYGLGRDGTVYVIAAGVAWHAGSGIYPKPPTPAWLPRDEGNWFSVGIEAESAGTVDDWTPAQRDAYPRLAAAICRQLGVGSDRVIGHKEYSSVGKPDPAFWDMNDFRADVARILEGDDMDINTPIPFSENIAGYFNATGGPGFGDMMANQFPQSGTAKFGVVDSWSAMSARAAYYKATEAERQIVVANEKIDTLTDLVRELLNR